MTDAPTTSGPDAAAAPEPWVPFWLVRLGATGWRVFVVLALAIVLLEIAILIGTVTAAVAVALVLSAAFAPLVVRLREGGWAPTKAAAVATLASVAVIGLVLLVGIGLLIAYGPDVIAALTGGLDDLEAKLEGAAVPAEIVAVLRSFADSLKGWISANVAEVVGAVASAFTVVLFGVFTTFFMLQDGDRAWAWAMQAASERRRAAATASAMRGLGQVGGYLRTLTVMAAVEALIDLVLMVVFGVPNALPLATLVFVGGLIPYLGGLVATATIGLAALASIGPEATLVLLVLIVVANILEDRIVGRIAGADAFRIHPAVILIALPIGAVAAGLFGLIMAGPIAAFVTATGGSLLDAIRPDPTGDADEAPAVVPDWLDVLAQWSWRLLVGIGLIAIAVAAMVQVPAIFLPVVIATVLAATFAPLTRALRRRGWGTSVSAAVVTVGVYLGIAAIIGITVAALLRNVADVVAGAGDGAGSIDDALGGFAGVLEALVAAIGAGLTGIVPAVLVSIVGVTFAIVLGAILTFFFLRDARAAWDAATGRLAPWRRQEAGAAGARAVGVLGGYMVGTGAISAFGAITQLLIMVVLGIPLALPLAVLSFFGGFIPYIGSLLTTGLAFLVTVAYGDTTDIVVMAVFTIVFNIVTGNIVAPLVYGRAVNIHPAIVLLAIPAGGAVAGVLGMFLVVPFLGVVATTWRSVLTLMGEERPVAQPPDLPEANASEPGVPGRAPVAERLPTEGALDG